MQKDTYITYLLHPILLWGQIFPWRQLFLQSFPLYFVHIQNQRKKALHTIDSLPCLFSFNNIYWRSFYVLKNTYSQKQKQKDIFSKFFNRLKTLMKISIEDEVLLIVCGGSSALEPHRPKDAI